MQIGAKKNQLATGIIVVSLRSKVYLFTKNLYEKER